MNYSEEALKTATNPEKVSLSGMDVLRLQTAFCSFQELSSDVKKLKEKIFYGNKFIDSKEDTSPVMFTTEDPRVIDSIHACLGVITESFEVLESVLSKNGQFYLPESLSAIDLVEVIKERGDLLWYENLLNRAFGTTEDQVKEANIKKLRKRYGGDKFDSKKAIAKEDNVRGS